MTPDQVEQHLQGAHVAVLSVPRSERGPVAVPVWFEFADGRFMIVTSPDTLHGRLVRRAGRTTITVHSERYGDDDMLEWYVMAEGPATFTDEDIEPIVRRTRSRYHGGQRIDEWLARPIDPAERVLVIEPQTLTGHESVAQL
jgi:nitroimidazol reductase NimA-like FMN-containing flavoprotein (pyridoxamine 5'-phosphate oxidase superfamily)